MVELFGDEAVFEIWPIGADAREQIWALDPDTKAWRRLDAETPIPRIDPGAVVADDETGWPPKI